MSLHDPVPSPAWKGWGQPLIAMGAISGIALLLWAARDAIGPYLLGFIGIYILLPVVRWVERLLPDHGWWSAARRPIAAISTSVGAIVLVLVLLGVLLNPLIHQTGDLLDNLPEYWSQVQAEHDSFGNWYQEHVPDQIRTWVDSNLAAIGKALAGGVAGVFDWLLSATGSLLSAAMALVAVPLFMIYYMIDEPNTVSSLRKRLPGKWSPDLIAMYRIFDRVFGSYTRGVILESAIVGVITGFGYWVIGVELALPLGVIAFVGEIVPILGPWIAFGISFPVVLATQPHLALPAIAIFGVVQALEGWFLAPRIQGDSVDFSSAGTLLIIAAGGAIAGALGVVFALPAAALLRTFLIYLVLRMDGVAPNAALAKLPAMQSGTQIGDSPTCTADSAMEPTAD